MNSQILQKRNRLIKSQRINMQNRSVSYLGRYKIDDLENRSIRLKTQSKQLKNIRLKTEYKNSRIKDNDKKLRTHSFLNSQNMSKIKQTKKLYNNQMDKNNQSRMDSVNNGITQNESITNIQSKGLIQTTKLSNQWVNSLLPTMTAQALYEQNHQLKKQINYLKQQNNRLTSRLNIQKKDKQRLAKQLSLQNQYYNYYQLIENTQTNKQRSKYNKLNKVNNKYGFHPVNYMITGIKYRYEKLKQQYQTKCEQVSQFYKITQYTQLEQLIKHNQILETDNTKLVDKIKQLSNIFLSYGANSQNSKQDNKSILQNNCFKSLKYNIRKQQSKSSLTISQPKSNQQSHLSTINCFIQSHNYLKQNNDKLQQTNTYLQTKIASLQLQLQQKKTKLKNLHKTITLLDNQVYHKKKQINKLFKHKKQLQSKITYLQKQNAKIKVQCQQSIQNHKLVTQRIFQNQKKIFMNEIKQKNQKIAKIQKQVSYLSTLLKYWKPLDQNDQQSYYLDQSNNNQLSSKHENIQYDQSSGLRSSIRIMSNRKRTKTKISVSNQKQKNQQFKLGLKQPVLSVKQSFSNDNIEDNQNNQLQQQNRQPKTSRKKHSSNGYKVRKINPHQLQYLKQQIKYRCLAHRLAMNQIKQLFTFKSHQFIPQTQTHINQNQQEIQISFKPYKTIQLQNNQKFNKKQLLWKQQYINMKQLKSIFVQSPFNLTKDQAHKLSRFIVQDTTAQHVYCDQENQIERQIVKSIIKAFIGDYYLPNLSKCKYQLSSILQSYGVNLKRALDTLSQKGHISPVKLIGLMQSLNIQVSQQLKTQIITRLYQLNDTRNINSLKYQPLFQIDFIKLTQQ